MPISLTSFRVKDLHGRKSFDIKIEDNKLILVGENGSGKTTLINLLYFFLSRQWSRMTQYRIGEIGITINNQELELSSQDLKTPRTSNKYWLRLKRTLPMARLAQFEEMMAGLKPEDVNNIEKLRSISRFAEVPMGLIQEWLLERMDIQTQLPTNIDTVTKTLRDMLQEQVLYLPTYRRIEQDLKTIFPQIDLDEMPWRKLLGSYQKSGDYIELVEFGMEDVDQRIEKRMNELKDNVRNGLNKLTGSYLREVISERYKAVNVESIGELQEETIELVISQIEENILPKEEKKRLRKLLKDIQSTGKIKEDQKVIAHFLLQLVDLHRKEQLEEKNVRQFVLICNKYLRGKKLVFDNNSFTVSIKPTLKNGEIDEDGSIIAMRHLSSGEKQIVSLFSHLFLSMMKGFFVLIDEPELSLSVPWQKDFLIDILETGYCNGLIAVTHSPFIFENALDSYTHAVDEFWV